MMDGQATAKPRARRVALERWITRLDRAAAWVSAILLFLYLVSGFGLTKPVLIETATGGLITWNRAYDIHYHLHFPMIGAFTIHTFLGVRRALIRTTRRKRLAGAVALVLAVPVIGLLLTLSIGR